MVVISATFDEKANQFRPGPLYPNWGVQWRRAKVNDVKNRLVRVAVVGDSLSHNEGSTSWLTEGWTSYLRDTLQAAYGDGGSGFVSHNYRLDPAGGVTTTGAWTDVDNEGGICRRSIKPTVAGNGATITMPVRGTSIDIWTRTDPTFGTFHYNIDGAGFVAMPLNVAASIKLVTVPVSPGNHSVVVRATTGDGRFYGVRGRNTTGVIVENMSVQGTMLTDVALPTSGVTSTDPYDNTVAARTLAAIGPCDVVILMLGANDALIDADDTVYLPNIWNAIAAFQAAAIRNGRSIQQPPDLIVVGEHVGQIDVITGFSAYERDYMQLYGALREGAAAMGAAFIDCWAAGGNSWDYWAGLGYWAAGNTDIVHPNNTGHKIYASLVLDLMLS